MFSRNRKPLTQPQGDSSEPAAKGKPSQYRQKIKFLRSLPIIRRLWLLFQAHKSEPFTWVLLAYCSTLFLAATTLQDPHADLMMYRKPTNAAAMIKGNSTNGLKLTEGHPWLSSFLRNIDSTHSNVAETDVRKKHSHGYFFHQVRKMPPRDVAEEKARQIEAKIQSIESYADAVEDYRNAFGMEPPRGFERWYNFAKEHKCITAPSLLSGAHLSVKPYLAYDPDLLRRRMNQMIDKNSGTWYFDLGKTQGLSDMVKDMIRIGGGAKGDFRVQDVFKLVNPLLSYIPEQIPGDQDLRLVFSVHDGPAAQSSWTLMNMSRQLAGGGLVWDKRALETVERQQNSARGWPFVCDPESPLARQSKDRVLNDEVAHMDSIGKKKSFIENHVATFDYCQNPSLMKLHGTMIVDERWASVMTPIISYCKEEVLSATRTLFKTLHNTDVMGVALDNVNHTVPEMKWEDKTINKVIWRGSFTGAFHSTRWDWQNSQRERIVNLANQKEGSVEVLVHVGKRIQRMAYPVEVLNELFLDIAPVGGAVQIQVYYRPGRKWLELKVSYVSLM
ncbi:hypothetical protein QFC21_002466 [Naganishia friedmannii]|uniref:Uncharacterized protein n=1 Tax=Naganishia friedmannii TaxID=89922 RepID=A0ACC2VX46_9TREE|nr:hypothetical protein QFC21_002466 [Naganishia friedmannii]